MTVSIGSDPELMLQERSTGRIIAACGLIGGTKGKALPMEGLPDGFGIQEDNVMLEFNIPAVSNGRDFSRAISSAIDWIDNMLVDKYPALQMDQGEPSRILMSDQLVSRKAQEFGCAPDFEAHDQGAQSNGVNPNQLEADGGAWRFNGGHVHIGYDANVPHFVAAQFADVYLGLPSVGLDNQGERRKYYGGAGRFRPCPYGIEYRTLSNFWLWDVETTRDVGRRAYNLGAMLESRTEKQLRDLYGSIPWIDVAKAINTDDQQMANDLMHFIENKGIDL